MDLSEKIQKLRKERGLTQEQFAEMLFVSRTAVSKWETGRGIPSMESLQMIAKIYGITLDELLQAEEIIAVAKKENAQNINRFASYTNGIFNIATILSILLPLYKSEQNGIFYSLPLYQFKGWLAVFYWFFPIAIVLCGIFELLLSKSEYEKTKKSISIAGQILNICAILLLILSGQPYPAILFFVFLIIKLSIVIIKQK